MKFLKIALVAAAIQLTVPAVSAQEATVDVAAMFATAQSNGKTITDFVAEATDPKTGNPAIAEQVLEFAMNLAKNEPKVLQSIMQIAAKNGVAQDTIVAVSVASGIDPTVVTEALNTATAAGAATDAGAGAAPAATAQPATTAPAAPAPTPAPAPAPGGNGIGGGTGAGAGEAASGN